MLHDARVGLKEAPASSGILRSAIMAVLRIVFRPAGGGVALASWDEVDAKVGALLRRVRHRFGVQEVWTHARFFLRCMFTEVPTDHFALSVFGHDDPRADPEHPAWPIVARLARATGWRAFAWEMQNRQVREVPLPIPGHAADAPLPEDHTDRVSRAVAAVDLTGLDEVPWHELHHAYGVATDVPALIVAAASADADARREAYRSLYGNIVHQGSTYPATVAAAPFFVRILASDRPGPDEDALFLLLAMTAYDEAGARAVAAGEEHILALAASGSDSLAWMARRLIAQLARVSPRCDQQLDALVAGGEADARRREQLVWWLGQLPPTPSRIGRLQDLLAAPPLGRVAAIAMAALRQVTPLMFDRLVEALVSADAIADPGDGWIDSTISQLASEAIAALEMDDVGDHLARAIAFLEHQAETAPLALADFFCSLLTREVGNSFTAGAPSAAERALLQAIGERPGMWQGEPGRLVRGRLKAIGLPAASAEELCQLAQRR
jgi:hypothetical protein